MPNSPASSRCPSSGWIVSAFAFRCSRSRTVKTEGDPEAPGSAPGLRAKPALCCSLRKRETPSAVRRTSPWHLHRQRIAPVDGRHEWPQDKPVVSLLEREPPGALPLRSSPARDRLSATRSRHRAVRGGTALPVAGEKPRWHRARAPLRCPPTLRSVHKKIPTNGHVASHTQVAPVRREN